MIILFCKILTYYSIFTMTVSFVVCWIVQFVNLNFFLPRMKEVMGIEVTQVVDEEGLVAGAVVREEVGAEKEARTGEISQDPAM